MDVLIKNLELPKEDNVFLVINPDGKVEIQVGWNGDIPIYGVAEGIEAIEVPSHGRLIDADEELYQLSTSFFPQDMETTKLVARYRRWIKNAPTVLEASDEGNIFINSLTN